MIATGAGRDDVIPDVLSPEMAWINVVDGQVSALPAAVLAGEIVASKHLASIEFHAQTWPMDHLLQADDGWARDGVVNRLDGTAAIHDQGGFIGQNESNGSPHGANINRLKICIQDQHVFEHSASSQDNPCAGIIY